MDFKMKNSSFNWPAWWLNNCITTVIAAALTMLYSFHYSSQFDLCSDECKSIQGLSGIILSCSISGNWFSFFCAVLFCCLMFFFIRKAISLKSRRKWLGFASDRKHGQCGKILNSPTPLYFFSSFFFHYLLNLTRVTTTQTFLTRFTNDSKMPCKDKSSPDLDFCHVFSRLHVLYFVLAFCGGFMMTVNAKV